MKIVKVVTSVPGLGGESSLLVTPEDYLGASGEALFLIICMSWTIAYFFSYENILSNPLKDMLGYNDVCVAWDVPPALYPASFFFIVPVYFGIRYAITDLERAALSTLSSTQMCAVRVANMLYVLSIAGVPLIFIITPAVNAKLHTCLFIQLIFFRLIVVAGNYVEAKPSDVSTGSKVFFFVYAVVSILLLTCFGISLALYEKGGSPVVPPAITMTCDYMWFFCLPLTTRFLPQAPAIRFDITLEKKDGARIAQDTIGAAG